MARKKTAPTKAPARSWSHEVTKHSHALRLDKGVFTLKDPYNVDDVALAWGKKVTPAFKHKVIEISAEIGMDPNFLMAAMAYESARTFSASIQNPPSKAVGLIQFMPNTARALGTSTEALKRMTPLAQLDYVRRYFLPNKGRLRDLSDVYMAILWPRAIGRPSSYILFAYGSNQYKQNRGLDADNDGVVTKAEAANRVQ